MEIWRDIVGYEGKYQISNYGRVKNLKTNKLMTSVEHHSGYMLVCLSKAGMAKNFNVHRLVASAFVPNPYNLPQINHRDENKQNNNAENLEWCTQKYNNTYGSRIEKTKRILSKKVMQYDLNGRFIKAWASLTDAAHALNICKSGISQCCAGKSRNAGGFVWKYEKEA